jgi:hypothetical protein
VRLLVWRGLNWPGPSPELALCRLFLLDAISTNRRQGSAASRKRKAMPGEDVEEARDLV